MALKKIDLKRPNYFDSTFFYFLQVDNENQNDNNIVITYENGSKKHYKLNEEKEDFRSFYCRAIGNDSVVYSYKKMPLVSNSMKHPGSIFSSDGRIYKHSDETSGYSIAARGDGITLIKAIIADK